MIAGGLLALVAVITTILFLSRQEGNQPLVTDAQRSTDLKSPRVVTLIPAYNEEESIANTLQALADQTLLPDQIVAIPNGCVDNTAEIARAFPGITVLELPKLAHGKSEALNTGWHKYARNADIVICLDADTVLPPNAVEDWVKELEPDLLREPLPRPWILDTLRHCFATRSLRPLREALSVQISDQPLGGSSSKFTMLGNDFLTRLQRAEFARWTDTSLSRGWTSVLAGTGCAISGEALRRIVESTGRPGPWCYDSLVEDFELTYRIRQLGWRCQVSPTVRAYTDSMRTVKALLAQRMKWQAGTVEDLLKIGVNQLTLVDWWQQFMGLFMAATRILWVGVLIAMIAKGVLQFNAFWWVAVPLLFVSMEVYSALRIPHRDRIDVLFALLIIPAEIFAWLRSGWFIKAWIEVLVGKLIGKRRDHWQLQYAAEAKEK